MGDERILEAARRVLEGDESRAAATELEAAIPDSPGGDERFEDLLEALALYAPGSGMPYYEPAELRLAVRDALVHVGLDATDQG